MASKVGKKEVSVGEFDELTGLTHVTLQRGRLMFNMGPPSTKRTLAGATNAGSEERPPARDGDAPGEATAAEHAPRPPQRVYRSGVSTGRSLFVEETVYLMQRGALVVYALEELEASDSALADASERPREPLSVAQLLALVVGRHHATLAVLDVYAFLKDNKLHPRRSTAQIKECPRHMPRHGEATAHLFLFDVFKTITETQYVPVETTSVPGAVEPAEETNEPAVVKMRKRKVKRLALIFRVAVSAFRDASPRPSELRRLMSDLETQYQEEEEQGDALDDDGSSSTCRGPVPLKLAVADVDRSVLLFEVA